MPLVYQAPTGLRIAQTLPMLLRIVHHSVVLCRVGLSSKYKILVRVCRVKSAHRPSPLDTACKDAHIFTPDSFVERIHSYQEIHGVVSNRDVSIMATLMTTIVVIPTAMWVTVRRRRPRLAQTRWGLASPASPLTSLVYRIGSDTSLEITDTGMQTWLPTITLVAATL
jgi:hypothetical protein